MRASLCAAPSQLPQHGLVEVQTRSRGGDRSVGGCEDRLIALPVPGVVVATDVRRQGHVSLPGEEVAHAGVVQLREPDEADAAT